MKRWQNPKKRKPIKRHRSESEAKNLTYFCALITRTWQSLFFRGHYTHAWNRKEWSKDNPKVRSVRHNKKHNPRQARKLYKFNTHKKGMNSTRTAQNRTNWTPIKGYQGRTNDGNITVRLCAPIIDAWSTDEARNNVFLWGHPHVRMNDRRKLTAMLRCSTFFMLEFFVKIFQGTTPTDTTVCPQVRPSTPHVARGYVGSPTTHWPPPR